MRKCKKSFKTWNWTELVSQIPAYTRTLFSMHSYLKRISILAAPLSPNGRLTGIQTLVVGVNIVISSDTSPHLTPIEGGMELGVTPKLTTLPDEREHIFNPIRSAQIFFVSGDVGNTWFSNYCYSRPNQFA